MNYILQGEKKPYSCYLHLMKQESEVAFEKSEQTKEGRYLCWSVQALEAVLEVLGEG